MALPLPPLMRSASDSSSPRALLRSPMMVPMASFTTGSHRPSRSEGSEFTVIISVTVGVETATASPLAKRTSQRPSPTGSMAERMTSGRNLTIQPVVASSQQSPSRAWRTASKVGVPFAKSSEGIERSFWSDNR